MEVLPPSVPSSGSNGRKLRNATRNATRNAEEDDSEVNLAALGIPSESKVHLKKIPCSALLQIAPV